MISTSKWLGLTVVAFVAGSFVASPELRAYAAATIGSAEIIDDSIQSIDIGNGQVKTADLGNNAATSIKIKDGDVKNADIANGAVTKSKLGADVLDTLTVTKRFGPHVTVLAGQTIGSIVSCQSGEVITGGGFVGSSSRLVVFQNTPNEFNNEWNVSVYNPTSDSATITSVVICAKLSP